MTEEEKLLIEKYNIPVELLTSEEGRKRRVTISDSGEVIYRGTIKELLEEIKRQKEYSKKPSINVKVSSDKL
jgi:ABC-type multidrug transport system ATPase subunit